MSASGPVVYVVDDDATFLAAVAHLLRAAGYAVRTFASASEFLAQGADAVGCVVTDLRMPGMNGIELQQAMTSGVNVLPVIFLTGVGDIPTTVQAMRQGAEDFLVKNTPKEALFEAIERALARDARERGERARVQALRDHFDGLTPRDRVVLRHVMDGKLNKQIAADLGISERSVKLHRTAITTKLQVRSVAELTRLVQSAGIIEDRPATLPKGK